MAKEWRMKMTRSDGCKPDEFEGDGVMVLEAVRGMVNRVSLVKDWDKPLHTGIEIELIQYPQVDKLTPR